jgi:tRNA1Val (adenine37-N6)-methyltransferase
MPHLLSSKSMNTAQPKQEHTTRAEQALPAVQEAAAAFPRGLIQPEGSYRFGLDALLLAAFATASISSLPRYHTATGRAFAAADLGTGCGVVAAGLALQLPALHCLAFEKEAPLAHAAELNMARLGLGARVRVHKADLAQPASLALAKKSSLDAVLMNPPYRLGTAGRPSPSLLRQGALAGEAATLEIFARAAAALLKHHAPCYAIFAASGLPRLIAAFSTAGLGLRRILPVYAREGQAAKMLLIQAAKGAQHDLHFESPLLLYSAAQSTAYSAQAQAFCPWL